MLYYVLVVILLSAESTKVFKRCFGCFILQKDESRGDNSDCNPSFDCVSTAARASISSSLSSLSGRWSKNPLVSMQRPQRQSDYRDIKTILRSKSTKPRLIYNVSFARNISDDPTDNKGIAHGPLHRKKLYGYTKISFDKIRLSQKYDCRLTMISDLFIQYTQTNMNVIKDKLDFIESVLLEYSQNDEEILSIHENFSEQFFTFASYFALNDDFAKNIPTIIEQLSIFPKFQQHIELISNYIEALNISGDGHRNNKKSSPKSKQQTMIRKVVNRRIDSHSDELLEEHYYKYKSINLHVGQRHHAKSMKLPFLFQFGVIHGLVRSILNIFDKQSLYPPYLQLYKLDSCAHIRAKMLFETITLSQSPLPSIGAVSMHYYQSLSEWNTPSVHSNYLQTKIFSSMIRSFPGDMEFFRYSVVYEQIIRYDENGWNIFFKANLTTNNIPKTINKWIEIVSKIQSNYDHLVSDKEFYKDTFVEQGQEYLSWSEDLYLVLSILLAELNGTFGIQNHYTGESRFYGNTFPLMTSIWFEYPMTDYNEFSAMDIERIYNSEERIHATC